MFTISGYMCVYNLQVIIRINYSKICSLNVSNFKVRYYYKEDYLPNVLKVQLNGSFMYMQLSKWLKLNLLAKTKDK